MLSVHLFEGTPLVAGLLVEFLLAAGLVVWLATLLTHYADLLEKQSQISALFIGGVFLAIVTSLPEAVVTVGAAVMDGALALGVGNLFGSNMFNLLIVVFLDLVSGPTSLVAGLSPSLRLSGWQSMAIMLLVGAAVGLHVLPSVEAMPGIVGGASSVAVFAAYLGFKLGYLGGGRPVDEPAAQPKVAAAGHLTLRQIGIRLVVFAILLVLVSVWLLRVCDTIAETPISIPGGELVLGRTLTGTFLLSAATSFPEMFVCLAALRLGQRNMAVANLLGSNMVNMFFVPIMHLFSRRADFYAVLDAGSVAVMLAASMVMTLWLIAGMRRGARRKVVGLSWTSAGMLLTYLVGAYVLVKMGLSL